MRSEASDLVVLQAEWIRRELHLQPVGIAAQPRAQFQQPAWRQHKRQGLWQHNLRPYPLRSIVLCVPRSRVFTRWAIQPPSPLALV